MSGNVWEWCSDLLRYYPNCPAQNPLNPALQTYHVIRGGYWGNNEDKLRSACRRGSDPMEATKTVGFRCVKSR